MSASVHEVKTSGGTVKLTTRAWDGIDRPDYSTFTMEPHEARVWAQKLLDAADIADVQQHEALLQKRDELIADIAVKQTALAKAESALQALNSATTGPTP